MIIAKSDVLTNSTIAVTPASSSIDPVVMVGGDFSGIYSDALTSTEIEFTFVTAQNIQYVAIGGSNVAQKTDVTIETSAGLFNYDADLSRNESNVLFYTAQSNDHSAVTTLTITITGSGQLQIADIAAGESIEIEQNVQSGYARSWSVPNKKVRSTANLIGAPIATTYEARDDNSTLTVSRYIMEEYADHWYQMLEFACCNTFYIREDDDAKHSYACFNAQPKRITADSQSPLLGGASITYNTYSKGVI